MYYHSLKFNSLTDLKFGCNRMLIYSAEHIQLKVRNFYFKRKFEDEHIRYLDKLRFNAMCFLKKATSNFTSAKVAEDFQFHSAK